MITILTPSYNRADHLKRLAKSLESQSSYEFEWLIVDDGSEDSTKELISSLEANNSFPVRYIHKENGGKHTALNVGFDEAKGDWIFIVDSDDWLKENCIEKIHRVIQDLNDDIGSISILKAFESGKIIGEKFPVGLDNYIDRIEKNIIGDKGDVFKKSALNGFRFPVFSGEKFMAESPLFIWFGKNFKTSFINYPGYICEYQDGGLSDNSIKNRHKYYNSTLYVYNYQYVNFNSRKMKAKAAINWWRFRIGKENIMNKSRVPFFYCFFAIFFFAKDFIRK